MIKIENEIYREGLKISENYLRDILYNYNLIRKEIDEYEKEENAELTNMIKRFYYEKNLINSFLHELSKNNLKLISYVKLRYFNKLSKDEIIIQLNLSESTYKSLDEFIIHKFYINSTDKIYSFKSRGCEYV